MTNISVIVTCYREGDQIFDAINSLLRQTDNDFDITLVNDCSPDKKTNDACKKLSEEGKVTVIRNETNLGLSGARNTAIEKSNGDVVVLLDADDILPSDAIYFIRKTFENYPSADYVYGNYTLAGKTDQKLIDCSAITDEKGFLSPVFLANNWILLGTSPFRKKLWAKIGGYSLEFSNTCQDLDFWQRAILHEANGKFIDHQIYIWNRLDSGMNKSDAHKQSLSRCNYKNIDFIMRYNDNIKEAFNIALTFNDEIKIKNWSEWELSNGNRSWFALAFYYSPLFLVSFYIRVIQFKRRLRKYLI